MVLVVSLVEEHVLAIVALRARRDTTPHHTHDPQLT